MNSFKNAFLGKMQGPLNVADLVPPGVKQVCFNCASYINAEGEEKGSCCREIVRPANQKRKCKVFQLRGNLYGQAA